MYMKCIFALTACPSCDISQMRRQDYRLSLPTELLYLEILQQVNSGIIWTVNGIQQISLAEGSASKILALFFGLLDQNSYIKKKISGRVLILIPALNQMTSKLKRRYFAQHQ